MHRKTKAEQVLDRFQVKTASYQNGTTLEVPKWSWKSLQLHVDRLVLST